MTCESIYYLSMALQEEECQINRMCLEMETEERRANFLFVLETLDGRDIYKDGFSEMCKAVENNTSIESIQIGRSWDASSLLQLFYSLNARESFILTKEKL